MCLKRNLLGVFLVVAISCHASAQVIVDDDFSDGNRAMTGALDTNWWTSSSSSGIEDNNSFPSVPVGTLGLVTGTSGRGIHTVFPTQTLANVGDKLNVEYTFTTPTTIDAAGGNSAALRVGLFDTVDRAADLNQDISASSSSPNPVYGWGIAVNDGDGNPGPGTTGLPGYMLDMDVFAAGDPNATATDLNFREHIVNGITETGRLMATTTNWSGISPSGPDEGYTWAPNTEYSGSFSIMRSSATEVMLTGTLGSATYTNVDEIGNFGQNATFGMLAFHTNSNKFGASNTPGDPDNGLDFSRITITFKPVPEPASASLLALAGLALLGLRRR